jgi:hypothetical protein
MDDKRNEKEKVEKLSDTDPFFSEKNLEILRKSIQEAEEGKLTPHELIEE